MSKDGRSIQRQVLFKRFWRYASGFWTGVSRREAWFLTITLFVIILAQIYVQYRINVWNRDLFNGLEKKDFARVGWLALLFLPLAVATVGLNVASVWGRLTTQRAWRAWLTDHLIDRWLQKGRYYQLNLVRGQHENPEFRIADDTRIATESPIDFIFGVTTAVLTAATFIGVLWAVGGAISLELAGRTVTIPGYLVIMAVIYSLITTVAMFYIGRAFVRVAEDKNQSEASFRYALTRLRENGESIALLGGEAEERGALGTALGLVIQRWKAMCGQYMRTSAVSYSNFVLAPVLPVILCAPKYLAGTMSLGEVMQAASAFVTVAQSFNWMAENYPKLAEWTASANRVAGLMVSLDTLESAEQEARIVRSAGGAGPVLRLNGLAVTLDDGTAVVGETEVEIHGGEKVLVVGESGAGKSTLLRALAGLWPWGRGEVQVRSGVRMFFLPQKAYVPVGTLKRAAVYPKAVDEVADEAVGQALTDAGLGHLTGRLHEDAPWEHTLSGGEQQRLAFARVFLHQPDIIVMDEATAALDPATQDQLLDRIAEKLPHAAVISVGHRPELELFHQRRLVLARGQEGAKLVRDEPLTTGGFIVRRVLSTLFRRPRETKRTGAGPS